MIGEQAIEQLFHSLISGDSNQARRLIERVLAEGSSLDELIIEAYRPIAAMIESLCRSEQLSGCARDHATVLLQNLLDDARMGNLQTQEYECEIETTPMESFEPRRAFMTHRRDTELNSPFTTMSFKGSVLRVKLVGPQVNEREANIMREEIEKALDLVGPGLQSFILDLSEVHSMSSFGLGICIELRNKAMNLGAKSLMTGANQRLGDLLSLLNVDRLYENVDSGMCIDALVA